MQYKILVVDSDTSSLDITQEYLTKENMDVVATNDSLKALDLLEKKQFDMLITDVRMPLFSGIDLIRSARGFHPDLPIIILSSESTHTEVIEAVNLNVFKFIEKPLKNIAVLKDYILEAVDKKVKSTKTVEVAEGIKDELTALQNAIIDIYRVPKFGVLYSGIAHNINSPLGGVIGYTQLAMMKNPNIHGLDMVNQQAIKISQVLAGISDKGQAELSYKISDINLNDLINFELEYLNFNLYFKHQIEKNLILNDVTNIKAVYSHIALVFHHLLQNAQDAMFEMVNKKLTITTESNENAIILKIKDTGEGIPEEDLEKIFQPGFTTRQLPSEAANSDEPSGYGFGLFIVKNTLDEYNAAIEVESEVGKGSTFTITFPIESKKRKAGK